MSGKQKFYGPWMILAGFIMTFCSGPGQSFLFMMFQPYLLEEFQLSRWSFALIYGAGSFCSAILVSVVGRITDRVGVRLSLAVAAVLMSLACVGMMTASGVVSLSLALAVLRALGQGTIMLLCSLLMAQWYSQRRGRAMSIASMGLATSSAVMPALCLLLIDHFGWRVSYGILGLMLLFLLGTAAGLIVRNRPEDIDQHVDGIEPDSQLENQLDEDRDAAQPAGPSSQLDRRVWTSPRFWVLVSALASAPFVITALVFHQVSIFAEKGIEDDVAAGVMVVFAIAAACANLLSGGLIDRFGVRKVLRASLLLQILALLLVQVLSPGPMVVVYILVLGLANGSASVLMGVTWVRFYGRDGLGKVQGSAGTVVLTAAALAPMLPGAVKDITGSFSMGLWLCILVPITGLLFLIRELPEK